MTQKTTDEEPALRIIDEEFLRVDVSSDLSHLASIHHRLARTYESLSLDILVGERDIEEFILSCLEHGVPMIEGQGLDVVKLEPRETKTLRNPRSHTPLSFDYPIHRRRYVRSHTASQHAFRRDHPEEDDPTILHFPHYMPGVSI